MRNDLIHMGVGQIDLIDRLAITPSGLLARIQLCQTRCDSFVVFGFRFRCNKSNDDPDSPVQLNHLLPAHLPMIQTQE